MNIKAWNALLVVSLLIVLSGGGYILHQNNAQKQAEIAEEQLRLAEEVERLKQEKQALLQSFDDFLNGFLDDVYEQARAYKKSRVVLNELGKPSNLREPQYIEENARLAESTVLSLQLQVTDIMNSFEQADQEAQELLLQFEGAEQENLQQNWSDVRDQSVAKYTGFFAVEQDVIMAQLRLIEFYAKHSDVLNIDVENERILFDTVDLQEQEAMLRGEIIKLKAAQQDVLKAGG